jgi:hypothetical protein
MSYNPDPKTGERNDNRSRKIWDSCITCFDDIWPSSDEWDWRQCKRCKFISKSLKVFLTVGAAFALWQLWHYNKFNNYNLDLYTTGYLVDILGGWFLASGLSDMFILASSAWGGGGDTFKKFGKKNFHMRSMGLFLLTLGFIFQCVANIGATQTAEKLQPITPSSSAPK